MCSLFVSAFHVGVSSQVNLNIFVLQHVLKRLVQKLFAPIRLHPTLAGMYLQRNVFCEWIETRT